MSVFVIAGLLLCIQAPGSSALIQEFVKKGNDFLLEDPKSFVLGDNILTWRFNKRNNIVRFVPEREPIIFDDYSDRVTVINYSVKLKNLQTADSGVYEAHVSGDDERTLAEYNVTVQDPVTPVGLKVDFVSSGSDSCTINATCRTEDSDISSSFRCVNETCDQDGGEQSKKTNSGASLRIYLLNGLIICSHSNQVSWTQDMTKIQDVCFQPVEPLIFDDYTDRVTVINYSVKLKNLQAADSGVYEALVVGDIVRTLAEYNVRVKDPVTPVKLKVDFVSSSPDSCTINATCRTEDSDISSSFRCVNETCDQDGGEQSKNTNSGASLRMYLLNGLIICNHSNQVSWTQDMTKIQDYCKLDPVSESLSICLVKTVVFSVGLIIMVSAVVSVHLMEKCKKQK